MEIYGDKHNRMSAMRIKRILRHQRICYAYRIIHPNATSQITKTQTIRPIMQCKIVSGVSDVGFGIQVMQMSEEFWASGKHLFVNIILTATAFNIAWQAHQPRKNRASNIRFVSRTIITAF